MEHSLEKALVGKFLTILNEIPIPCQIVIDEGGNWDIKEFNKIWINKANLAMFSENTLGYFARNLSKSKFNSLQAQWNQIRQILQKGSTGFVGPFTSYISISDNPIVIHEYYVLLLNETEGEHRAFFTFVTNQDKIEAKKTKTDFEGLNLLDKLSKREIEITKLISEGMITKIIADKLSLSERTIENHRANIRKKLHLSRQTPLSKYLSALIPK